MNNPDSELQPIAPHIFLISGDSHPKICSNAYVLEGPGSLALIDSGVDAARVQAAVAPLDKPIERVFFTHGHFDHIQAAIKAQMPGQMAKADLDVLHELNAAWVNVQKPDFFKPFKTSKTKSQSETDDASQTGSQNDLAFHAIQWSGFQLDIIPTPGHTPGSVSFLDHKQGILFSGDCKFANGGVGRTDFWGGDPQALDKSLAKIESLDFRLLAPGHGPLEEK